MKGSTVLFRMVSIRHLLHRRLRSAITLVGVAGGVTLLLSVTLINATLHSSIQTSAQNVAGNAQIEVSATDQAGLPDRDVAVINSVSGVDQAIPVIRETSRLLGPKAEVRTLIVGVTPSFPTLFSGTTRTGSIVIDGGFGRDGNGILLSLSVARVLHVVPGDAIRIRTPNGDVQGHVTGTLSGNALTGVNGGSLGIMQLSAAQTMFARPGRVDSIYLRTRAGASVEGIKAAIRRRLKGAGLVGAPGDRTRGFEQTFAALASLGSLAGIVSLFVALFVVYNSMSMSFAERRRETSMAMALGAGRRQVFRALLAEAALLGTLASFGGAVAGIVLAKLLVGRALAAYRVFPITAGGSVHIDPVLILIAVAGGITVSMLGAYVPAKGVTRVAPIESLRPSAPYENLSSPRQFPARSAKLVAICALFIGIAGTLVTARRDHIPTGLMSLFVLALLCGITLLLPSIVSVATRAIRPLMMRFGTLGRLAADGQERNPGRTVLTVGALLVTSAFRRSPTIGSALPYMSRRTPIPVSLPINLCPDR